MMFSSDKKALSATLPYTNLLLTFNVKSLNSNGFNFLNYDLT